MLYLVNQVHTAIRRTTALLFFISCITLHTQVCADIKDQTAEQYRALGYTEQQKGNLNEALANYTKAASLGLESPVLFNDMGVLYEEIDLNKRAEQYYLMAIQADDRYLPSYMNLAYLYQRLGHTEKAAQFFKRRYELGNLTDPWAQKAKAELIKLRPGYQQWAKTLEAESFNKQLVAKSREEFNQKIKISQQYFKSGNTLFKDEQYEEAVKEYDQALRYAPKNPKIQDARNKALLEIAKQSVKEQSEQAIKRLELGDTVSARHEIQKILTTIPNEPILISR